MSSLHSKIDELLKRISEMEFKTQHGQEIIYNEVEDLKNLPALKKKTWDEIVKGKIVKLAMAKLTDGAFLDWLHRQLTGTEFTLLKSRMRREKPTLDTA